jgi:hypothetical protein
LVSHVLPLVVITYRAAEQACLMSLHLPVHLLLLLLPIVFFWYKGCCRVWATYGVMALLSSPVLGWLPLLVVLLLRQVWRGLINSSAVPAGGSSTGGHGGLTTTSRLSSRRQE